VPGVAVGGPIASYIVFYVPIFVCFQCLRRKPCYLPGSGHFLTVVCTTPSLHQSVPSNVNGMCNQYKMNLVRTVSPHVSAIITVAPALYETPVGQKLPRCMRLLSPPHSAAALHPSSGQEHNTHQKALGHHCGKLSWLLSCLLYISDIRCSHRSTRSNA
jgi:hypothetical protein